MVLVPILAPVALKLGVDPIQFAMIVIYNLTLGMITPPVGGPVRHLQRVQGAAVRI
jgi:TRAP-type C4-dicarboxylate transport system permease large subunit